MLRHVFRTVLLAAAVAMAGGNARAGDTTLSADLLEKVRIDGMLREWPRAVVKLNEEISGSPSGRDPRVSAVFGYDDQNLYVAMKVRDEKFVRTRGYGKREDHAVVIVAFPSKGGSYSTSQVLLYPGLPGKIAGVVKTSGGGKVPGAKIVEAPMDGGYTFEAQIPWKTFRQARRWRVGLRGAIRFVDVDKPGKVHAIIGTSSSSSGRSLPRLLLQAERGLEEDIRHNDLGQANKVLFGDVAGDALIERVAIYQNYLTIVGPGYMKGKQFFYGELGVPDYSSITRFELRDVDGNGKDEIVLQKRLGGTDTYREVLIVERIPKSGAPEPIFLHDVAIVTPEGTIRNQVRFSKGRRGLAITISQDEADWEDQAPFRGATQEDIPSTLLPWETIGSRTYEWDGSSFVKSREKKTQAKKPRKSKKPKREREGPPAPPPPRPPNPEELLEKVYALYRKDRKMKKAEPRFDFVTDVAADEQMERVIVHERDLVVWGPGFMDGGTYTYTTMGFADPADILHVTARDLTGDGKAEIMARGVLRAEASEELGGATVERHAVFIYKVVGNRMQRVLAVETGRALGHNRVLGVMAFRSGSGGSTIELRPGHAAGWTKRTYPFPEDTETAGGLEPVPLPWSSWSHTYRFDGSTFARE